MKSENPDQAVHRSGPAKQDNKKHKTGRHRSKGILEIEKKGQYLLTNNIGNILNLIVNCII